MIFVTKMNNKGHIDISVPAHNEVEGPLGGTSVEYVISVIAEQSVIDKNCNTNEVINHKISKSFRECEDFYLKICKQYPDVTFPSLPKSLSNPTTSVDKRKQALNSIMKFISSLPDIVSSTLLIQFLDLKFSAEKEKVTEDDENDDVLDNSTIFKKMKIKPKPIVMDNENSNVSQVPNPSDEENIQNSQSEDEHDEDIFKQSRKRNETGSKPLFDENSINQRSEKLNQREPLMFDPQDYGGAISPEEEHIFLVPGAKPSTFLSFSPEISEDTSDLLSIDDNIDHLLKDLSVNKNLESQHQQRPPEPQPAPVIETRPKPPVPAKPVPAVRNRPASGADAPSIQKPRPTPKPRNLSKTTSVEEKALKEVDILKYIEDEQKNNNSEPDLFS